MKIFEDKKNPPTHTSSMNACGYCRKTGHNRGNCPHAPEDWVYFSIYQIPLKTTKVNSYWHQQPKYWGAWYEECKKTIELQQRNKQKTKTKRATIRYCGFCGIGGHTRRNCTDMKKFVKQCYKANENWRRAAYEILVKEHGIDIGAAVEVTKSHWHGVGRKEEAYIGLVTSVNWDSLNVMTAFDGGYDWNQKYGQIIDIEVMVDGKDFKLSLANLMKDTSLREIISSKNAAGGYYSRQIQLNKVIGRSEHPLKEEWVKSYKAAFNYLVKKTSLEQLEERGVYRIIQEWANRT